jgi:undecaprenyl-diphosphatase
LCCFLVVLPGVGASRWRQAWPWVVVGLTRIALGVHFVSTCWPGWLVGTGWLLVTATAFRAWRRSDGLAVPSAVDGLARRSRATSSTRTRTAACAPWTTVARLLVTAVLLLERWSGSVC